MLHVDDGDEESGPSVESVNPEERILARRIRIQHRIEQLKREALGDDALMKKEVKEEQGKGKEQIEESRKRLKKLLGDGNELVTNVRVAGDARESGHRIVEEEAKRARVEKLEAEAKASAEKFDEISKRWSAARMKEIPQDLHDMLKEQTTGCDAVIDEKNKLINILQQELKQKDDEYVKDLKKQSEDVDLIIERMEEQIKNLTKSHREELRQIEDAYTDGRSDMNKADRRKWDSMMQQRRDKEEDHMKLREKRVEEHERQLDQLRTQDAEEYNMVKIKLETDVQILEQQLQQMKATYQLNQEKLEYNFQVLKKRDEENTITKSQQKRKITRLQDVLNNLRIKLGKQERSYKDENQSLVDDYKRIAEQYKELHKKMKHFSATDNKKFHDIWCMNEEEVRKLVDKVLNTDCIIHQQQLGLPWSAPDTAFMDSRGPLLAATEGKEKSALMMAKEVLASVAKPKQDDSLPLTFDDEKSHSSTKVSLSAVKKVLELLCDEAGFLVEEKLNKLLRPLQNEERSLIKLDAIFKALNIESEDDIHKLAAFFAQHKEKLSDEVSESSLDHEVSSTMDGKENMHPNEVLKVLKQFVQEHIKPTERRKSKGTNKLTAPGRDGSQDEQFWKSMANIIPEHKLKMWDALTQAFDKYHKVLTERDVKIKETDSLRQQNAELRMLLHQYITSEVNRELEIPPTRVLQLEYS
ncbi:dynein regulatory complex protein 1-like [Styela clava]